MAKSGKSAPAANPSAGTATVAPANNAAPSKAGSATVAPSKEQIGGANSGSYSVEETQVIEWDPQALGSETSFEAEGGLDSGSGKVKHKENVRAGDAEIDEPETEIRTQDADTGDSGGDNGEPSATRASKDMRDRAERRAEVIRALKLEQKRRPLEDEARARTEEARTAREDARKLTEQLNKARTGTLEERLSLIGMTREELTDAVIMGGADAGAASDGKKKPDPEVEQLRAKLAELDAKLTKRDTDNETAAVERRAQEARVMVRDIITNGIKDKDGKIVVAAPSVPLVRGLGKEDDVIRAAWHTWKAHKEKGSVSDYIPAAAEVIEEQLEAKHPELAALKKRNRNDDAETETEETIEKPKAKPAYPAVGSRTSPTRTRTGNRRIETNDPDERTRIVIQEMGWGKRN